MNEYQYPEIPLSHQVVSDFLQGYERVNDKISYMLQKGELLALKRGLYVSSKVAKTNPYLNYNIANSLLGPSYVSRFAALSYYGLLGETVSVIDSVSLRRFKSYETKFGIYEYYPVSTNVFDLGLRSINVNEYCTFLMATPEKALCDLIWTQQSLSIANSRDMEYYLEEDLRFDLDFFERADINLLETCQQNGKKGREIQYLVKLAKRFQK